MKFRFINLYGFRRRPSISTWCDGYYFTNYIKAITQIIDGIVYICTLGTVDVGLHIRVIDWCTKRTLKRLELKLQNKDI